MNFNALSEALAAAGVFLNLLTIPFGIALIGMAFMRFRKASDARGTATANASWASILFTFLGGCFLIYFPATVEMSGQTLFGSEALAYSATSTDAMTGNKWVLLLIKYIELSGLLAMFRGYFLFAQMGSGKNQHDGTSTGGKVTTWVVSGALAYNIKFVNDVINSVTNFDFINFAVTLG